ncbi:threonine--tRNA ligase [Holzapfeliella floricola]|uniref:Threonine--tRNA ligase n=1 Tax=Holzapfeliella floricola DSM 23037 = JCM 16512 TaxID=1423744 RepID=A0A0R2DTS2_9LACO|nr:threonine--tRNA ligase [Holzapfeliella floricola]KRN03900.1 threonine--tRNA ligase [Holzapfeliella floricola DSM 23037 = JCM 16512]
MSFELVFPDGNRKQYDDAVSVKEVAKSISTSLAKKAVAGVLNGELLDLNEEISQDGKVEIVLQNDELGLRVLRDTAAFLFSYVAKKAHSDINFGESKAIEDGFYVDTDKENQIAVTELPELQEAMQKVIKSGLPIEVDMMDKADLEKHFENDEYKLSLLKAIDAVQIKVYKMGDFIDFGYKALLPNASGVKEFALLSVAGAYWQGKSDNPMLQRIYGTAFYKKADLEADLQRRADIKERDHRTLGRDLDLFFVDPKVGAGLPYWMPNGATIRRVIERYITDKELAADYEHVYTPILSNLDLYKTSGHWDHYREDMFPPMDMGDGEMLELRPMNCPSHIQVFKHHVRSYRDLPMRIAELGMMHRYEKSGALTGLQRVREMTLNDGHTFVELKQIKEEFVKILRLMMEVYKDFNITDYSFRLSYRDPQNTEKYFQDDEIWETAQTMLKDAMDDLGLDYYEAEGEAAFYGPKLDVQTKTALGNEETLSTIQLDFMLPEKFELSYIGNDGEEHRPVMIHRGIIGTLERFIAYLTELYKGAFPTWIAPIQARIIPVNLDLHSDYAKDIKKQMKKLGLRVDVDLRNEKMNYKIREAQTNKVPYTIIVGDQETASTSVSIRRYGQKDTNTFALAEFLDAIVADVNNYSREK